MKPPPENPPQTSEAEYLYQPKGLPPWEEFAAAQQLAVFRIFLYYTCLAAAPLVLAFVLWDEGINPNAVKWTLTIRILWCLAFIAVLALLNLQLSLQRLRLYVLFLIGSSLLATSSIFLLLGDLRMLAAGILLILFGASILIPRVVDLISIAGLSLLIPNAVLALNDASVEYYLDYNAFVGAGLGLLSVFVHLHLQAIDRRAQLLYQLREQQQELSRLASVDPLTQAWNRRMFFHLSQRELARADRRSTAIALAMLDFDHFKRVNDSFGHSAGDAVLVAVVNCWQSMLRQADILARVGGEEFVILLPDTSAVEGQTVVERLRSATEALAIEVEKGTEISITVSIGITERPVREPLDAALRRADAALYEAKRVGRNRVVTK